MMQHAIEHLKNGTEKDRGLAVLHADNAVELMLKELARSKGLRVINKKGFSLEYYECIDQLIGMRLKIPELPSIDLLHTERNNTYHLGNKPDKNKAEWLVYDVALNFLRRTCLDELKYDINSFSKDFKLPEKIKQEMELTRSEVVNQYLIKASDSLNSGMFENTVILSYIGIEALFREYILTREKYPIHIAMRHAMESMREKNILSANLFMKFEMLRKMRNQVAHGMAKADPKSATLALEVFKNVIDEIGLPLELKCKTCGVRFNSGIVMSRRTFETSILKANKHKCPNGHIHSYDKDDYIAKL
jgi:hypothetical protein